MSDNEKILTWKDFPEFYENETIKKFAEKPLWTVSTTTSPEESGQKKKMPIDMYALVNKQRIWGASFKREWNPLMTLPEVCKILPTATNNTYKLDALRDKIVVMDIEPSCPEILKQKFMELPYLYGETSMSGKGLHLIFPLPEEILKKYPDTKLRKVLQEQNHYYEILLDHMVTFTRNVITRPANQRPMSEFENIFKLLVSQAKPVVITNTSIVTDTPIENIQYGNEIVELLSQNTYKKTLEDFPHKKQTKKVKDQTTKYDNSAYEYGMTGFYYNELKKMLDDRTYKDHQYTDEECAVIVYEVTKSILPYRAKHDQTRIGMPWLLYCATTLIAKTEHPERIDNV